MGPTFGPTILTTTAAFNVPSSLTGPIASGQFETFSIEFAKTTTGTFTNDVIIANNDSDENPFTFTITAIINDLPSITVTFPAGGEVLPRNNNYNITWDTTGVTGDFVNIFILGGTGVSLNANAVPNTGSYGFFLPTSVEPTTNYIVLVISTLDSAINDTSEPFEIIAGNTAARPAWDLLK